MRFSKITLISIGSLSGSLSQSLINISLVYLSKSPQECKYYVGSNRLSAVIHAKRSVGYCGLQAVIRCGNPKGLLCGQSGLMQLQLLRTQKSFANTARNSRRARFLQTGRSSAAHPQDFRPASRCDRFQPPTSPGMPLRFETSADP